VDVAIPEPIGYFSFAGWKKSFLGGLPSHGKDGVTFYTEKESVTYRWFDVESAQTTRVGTWDWEECP
jgi:malonate-semialdehyde dehydrogenase (acetylating)/methylmalonate-semialdehyde dehydrogenase